MSFDHRWTFGGLFALLLASSTAGGQTASAVRGVTLVAVKPSSTEAIDAVTPFDGGIRVVANADCAITIRVDHPLDIHTEKEGWVLLPPNAPFTIFRGRCREQQSRHEFALQEIGEPLLSPASTAAEIVVVCSEHGVTARWVLETVVPLHRANPLN